MGKRIPRYIDSNDVERTLCPKCQGVTKVFYYSAVPEVMVCLLCKLAWELETEIRYRVKRMLKSEAKEFMEWGR